jgi:hypothetical protein
MRKTVLTRRLRAQQRTGEVEKNTFAITRKNSLQVNTHRW